DDGANAGRGRADHWQALFSGAEASLGEMLRRPPAAKPGVVRRIEDERRAILLVDDGPGKNHFVTELEADLAPFAADVDRAWPGTGGEVEVARREARQADCRQQGAHRQIFAIGDEVRLVVASDDLPARAQHEDAVGGAGDVKA